MSYACNGCTNRWTGLLTCHCSGCHTTFTGLGAFDAHRSRGKCLEPASVLTQKGEPRLMPVARPQWSGWSLAGDGTKWWEK